MNSYPFNDYGTIYCIVMNLSFVVNIKYSLVKDKFIPVLN
jgi:hypothetical protein